MGLSISPPDLFACTRKLFRTFIASLSQSLRTFAALGATENSMARWNRRINKIQVWNNELE